MCGNNCKATLEDPETHIRLLHIKIIYIQVISSFDGSWIGYSIIPTQVTVYWVPVSALAGHAGLALSPVYAKNISVIWSIYLPLNHHCVTGNGLLHKAIKVKRISQASVGNQCGHESPTFCFQRHTYLKRLQKMSSGGLGHQPPHT